MGRKIRRGVSAQSQPAVGVDQKRYGIERLVSIGRRNFPQDIALPLIRADKLHVGEESTGAIGDERLACRAVEETPLKAELCSGKRAALLIELHGVHFKRIIDSDDARLARTFRKEPSCLRCSRRGRTRPFANGRPRNNRAIGVHREGKRLLDELGIPDDSPLEDPLVSKVITAAQQQVESMHFASRKKVLEYDDVMDLQRKAIYGERNAILDGKNVCEGMAGLVESMVDSLLEENCPAEIPSDDWDFGTVDA